jgi:enoyl-CoA hydratase/carnithine racemase
VLYRTEERVAIITLNRPDRMNALNREVWDELEHAFHRAHVSDDISTIALVAEGRAFCAGADLSPGVDPNRLLPWKEQFQRRFDHQFRMWSSPKVIVAGVHGFALGRGLELALWCDIVVASEETKLGQPEVREGWLVHSVVPWLANCQQAKLFMLSGDLITAREAEKIGLVTRVVPTGAAAAEAIKLARRLSHVPAVTARAVKEAINGVYEQQGFRSEQASGIAPAALIAGMTAGEKGVEEIERIRKEQGFKASIKFRDAPFEG